MTLYESGATTDGNFYFAMEYVDGSTLDAWSRRPGHSVTDRVRLFAGICGAVRYAHARGSSTGTSSPATSWWTPRTSPTCWTSASRA